MPRPRDSGRIDVKDAFGRMQKEMLAQLERGRLIEHASTAGTEAEQVWLEMFSRLLPEQYRAGPAFVVDRLGRRSRQIDIAIFDAFRSGPVFPHSAGVHVGVESVYAVFEVKPAFSRQWLREAAAKADSVRKLKQDWGGRRILAGLLAGGSVWSPKKFAENLRRALERVNLDVGCCLEQGAFDNRRSELWMSGAQDPLLFFVGRLVSRLRRMGAAEVDLERYGGQ